MDLCNFTKISQEGTPLQLIGYINSIFSAFDREVKKQGLFKMDTIGDAYVAAGWLNSLDPAEATERCAAMIRLSQRILRVLEDHREVNGKDLRCRIGISTGEVYAGVLGRLQPRYHLFGETMRIAEQLEQRCAVDGVHVSAPVMKALSSRPGLQESRAGQPGTSSTRVPSPRDWTGVDISVGDQGRIVMRTRSSEDDRVGSGPAQLKNVNPTRTTIGEVSDLSPGAPPLQVFHRPSSVPSTFITRTPSSERAQPPRRTPPSLTVKALPQRMRAAGLALVDHFERSEHGSSYQLAVTAQTNGPMGHSEKELYASMMTAFAFESSDKSPQPKTPRQASAPSFRLFPRVQPPAGQLSRDSTSNPGRASMPTSPTCSSQVESSLVFAAAKTSPRRHSLDNYRKVVIWPSATGQTRGGGATGQTRGGGVSLALQGYLTHEKAPFP
ncbi:nucleotide cyclase [Baffinella frigidus]|nr:nucleotide cyclase [Cryptophyta sp. CCMP2293]